MPTPSRATHQDRESAPDHDLPQRRALTVRSRRWLPMALGLALVAVALSLVSGGGSVVPPAQAQSDTYYHHIGDGTTGPGMVQYTAGLYVDPEQFNFKSQNANKISNVKITLTVTPEPARDGCDASYNDDTTTTGTFVLDFPTAFNDFSNRVFFRNNDANNRLVLRPAGKDYDCEYRVTGPTYVGPTAEYKVNTRNPLHKTLIYPTGAHEPELDTVGNRWDSRARFSYENTPNSERSSTFRVSLTLTGNEGVPEGTRFRATFEEAPTAAGDPVPTYCTQGTKTRTLSAPAADGTTTGSITLLRRHPESPADCAYTVTWSENEVGVVADAYIQDMTCDTTVRHGSASTACRYSANPNPTVFAERTATLLPDGDLPVGTEVRLEIRPSTVGGALSASCTQLETATFTQGTGSDTATVRLVQTVPAGQEAPGTSRACRYDVFWQHVQVSGTWYSADPNLLAPQTNLFPSGSGGITAQYTSTFKATGISIDVPDIRENIDGATKNVFSALRSPDGPVQFRVRFNPTASSTVAAGAAGCGGRREATYAVQSDGTVAVVGTEPDLAAGPCVYDVDIRLLTSASDAYLEKSSHSSDDNQVSPRDLDAAATFTMTEVSNTALGISITTPRYSGPKRTVTVTVSRVTGSGAGVNPGCQVWHWVSGVPVDFADSAQATIELDTDGSTTETVEGGTLIFVYVDYPTGAEQRADRCLYDVTWSSTETVEGGGASAWTLSNDVETRFQGEGRIKSRGTLSATYEGDEQTSTSFDASVIITTTTPVAVATTFLVDVAPTAGVANCSDAVEDTEISVRAGRSESSLTRIAMLTGRPPDSNADCIYEVTFEPSEVGGSIWVLDDTFDNDAVTRLSEAIAMGSRRVATARHRYTPAPESTFDGSVNLRATPGVPAGTQFEVTVRPVAGSLEACTDETTFTISSIEHATDSAVHSLPGMLDKPAGAVRRCFYEVEWPNDETGAGTTYVKDAAFTFETALDGDNTAANGRYAPAAVPFMPSVTIGVPQIDGLVDGLTINIFEGLEFEVGFAPAASSSSLCSTESATYTVGTDGLATSDDVPVLIDKVSGVNCVYAVAFPRNDNGATAQLAQRAGFNADDELDVDDNQATASYETVRIVGSMPSYRLTTPPAGGSGNVVVSTVSVAAGYPSDQRVDGSCGVQEAGTANPAQFNSRREHTHQATFDTTEDVMINFRFIDLPAGATAEAQRCRYSVTWSNSNSSWVQQRADTELVGKGRPGSDLTYSAVYGTDTAFWPEVTINVPQITGEIGGRTINIFEGKSIEVRFAPTGGPSQGCTTTTATYTINADGTAVGDAPKLINQVGGSGASCEYAVTFDENDTGSPAQLVKRTGLLSDDDVVAGAAATADIDAVAMASYATTRIEGILRFDITTPPFQRSTVNAVFRALNAVDAPSDCGFISNREFNLVAKNGTWTLPLEDDGSTRTSNYDYIDFPEGSLTAAERCGYDITWNPSELPSGGESSEWVLVASDESFSSTGRGGETHTLSATYDSSPNTFFTPELSLRVPPIYEFIDGSRINVYSKVLTHSAGSVQTFEPLGFRVNFERSGGPMSGCLSAATTYTVQSDGRVTGLAPSLVRQVRGRGPYCVYQVDFPRADYVFGLLERTDEGLNDTVSGEFDDAKRATVTYGARPVRGTIEVEVTAPAFTGGDRSITLTVSPGAGHDADCKIDDADGNLVSSATRTIMLAEDGSTINEVLDSDGFTSSGIYLTDLPAGATDADHRCEYDLSWSTTVSGVPAGETAWEYKSGDATWRGTDTGHLQTGVSAVMRATYGEVDQTTGGATGGSSGSQTGGGTTGGNTGGGSTDATMFDAQIVLLTTDDVANGTVFEIAVQPAAGAASECVVPQQHQRFDMTVSSSGFAQVSISDLIDRPAGATTGCTYEVVWPPTERGGSAYAEDESFTGKGTELSAGSRTVNNQYTVNENAGNGGDQPADPGNVNQPAIPGSVSPPVSTPRPTGNTNRPASTGGGSRASGGGGGRTSGAGSSGGSSGGGSGSGGGAATGPWVVSATSRVPVAVSLAMPQRDFAVGTAIEVMLNVPGTCGDDTSAFAGLPAGVGVVYALVAQSGATAQVLATNALRLAGYAERGDQTSDCELRVTLITAPAGCRLDAASTDEAGRSYVELAGGDGISSYAATPRLTCG